VESSCELGNEPSGSIKCWELPRGCKSCGLSSGTQLHRVSLVSPAIYELLYPVVMARCPYVLHVCDVMTLLRAIVLNEERCLACSVLIYSSREIFVEEVLNLYLVFKCYI
jgi:hypothetical protein